MRVLVTGGCGYKGTVLVPMLLQRGYEVVVADIQWFGNFLSTDPRLTVHKIDVNSIGILPLDGVDAIIHLASVANDPCSDLNPQLTWETSCLATMQLADAAVRHGVSQFIYASSGSVYGVKSELAVTENLSLEPISEYNKTKMVSERVLMSYRDQMHVQVVRPATVCGISPRMRLDVSVNMLTMQALLARKITVFGGRQVRPNIHIDDICGLYIFLLENPQLAGIFNAGFENLTILEIAELIQQEIDCEIEITSSNDPRSYRLDSSKLLQTGFAPDKTVKDAVTEIVRAFRSGLLTDEPWFHNLEWMKHQAIA